MKKVVMLAVLGIAFATSAQSPTSGSIQVTPRNLDCGSETVGQYSGSLTYFTVKNIGTAPVAVNVVSDNPQFSVQQPNCGLLSKQTCFVAIIFKPSATGLRSGVVTVTKLEDGQSFGVNVIGTGTE